MTAQFREISKVLVANRGEIACRVFRTCQKLGIRTVGVFSEPDKNSQHVRMADEAYCIGPAQSTQSYLNQDKIFEVAKRAGAHAIHPGYGFLSENYEFAQKCTNQNVIFVGPPSQAIYDMGIKNKSKELMTAAGVPVVPGYHGQEAASDLKALEKEALKLGFPLMIKAVKGGGGKGMRIAKSAEEFQSQAQSCQTEAEKAFGDGALLIERFIEAPRHIEVQIFGDSHGNCVYLWERDCSVQRRHQKVIEEAPALGLTPETRRKIGQAAVNAAKAVNYAGAGTVEFIVENQDFYFMEMNTRLQVEHPVTEAITGLDLVEWQLLVAMGHELPIKDQSKIPGPFGHAFEMRVYAEDTTGGLFVPAPGLVHALSTPLNARVESAVVEGDEVSVHYDPMIAKVVVSGQDRLEAIKKADLALAQFNVAGVSTNIDFMRRILRSKPFQNELVTTKFIEENRDILLQKDELSQEKLALASLALSAIQDYNMGQQLNIKRFRLNSTLNTTQDLNSDLNNSSHQLSLQHNFSKSFGKESISVEKVGECAVSQVVKTGNMYHMQASVGTVKLPITAALNPNNNTLTVFTPDESFSVQVPTLGPLDRASLASGGVGGAEALGIVKSPMPGTLEKVTVQQGDKVTKGQQLGTLVAMKMEHVIRSPCDGLVDKVHQQAGLTVAKGSNLFTVTPTATNQES